MSLSNVISFEQVTTKKGNEQLCRNLHQAIRVINSDYQNIDWEDQEFLNRVLTDVLEILETSEGNYADN
jgi:hypothetical protein